MDPLAAIDDFAHEAPDEVPRSPRTMLPEDWALLAGSGLSAIAITWVAFYRLLPVEGAIGFWLVTWITFLLIYRFVVRATSGKLAATDRMVTVMLSSAALGLLTILVIIIGYVVIKGLPGITGAFFTQTLAKVGPLDPESKGGALHAIVGTLQTLALTVLMSVPLGIATAVFLNEVGGRWARPVRTLVDAMSGVPSVVAGLFIYSALILTLGWGFSGFAAALSLSVLMLPTVTRTCEVVLRLVPNGLREAALALGAPRWRVVLQVVLPTARSGVSTSVILGMARAVGETAPLILTALGSSILNANPFDGPQSSLPLYIWQLIRNSDGGQKQRAWAGALALLVLVLILFTAARALGRPRVARSAVIGGIDAVALSTIDPAFDLGFEPPVERHGSALNGSDPPGPDLRDQPPTEPEDDA